jgi:hypothetical protein
MNNVLERLKEESTWRGLITVAALAGLAFSPEQAESIVAAGLAVISAIWIFKKEK